MTRVIWGGTTRSPMRRVTTLKSAGVEAVEMPRNGAKSFCCGAGGAQMWKEEENGTARVNEARFAEAKATGRKHGCGGLSILPDDDERCIQSRWREDSSEGCGGVRGGEIEVTSRQTRACLSKIECTLMTF